MRLNAFLFTFLWKARCTLLLFIQLKGFSGFFHSRVLYMKNKEKLHQNIMMSKREVKEGRQSNS